MRNANIKWEKNTRIYRHWTIVRFQFCFWMIVFICGGCHNYLIFSLIRTPSWETGCLSNPYFLLTGCLGIQFFDCPLLQYSQLDYLWLPAPHCATHMWLTGCYVMPLVTRCFPPNFYPRKQRISLGVAIILSKYLWSHT